MSVDHSEGAGRPTAPDEGILAAAAGFLADRGIVERPVTWMVGERMLRRGSTIFRLRASDPGGRVVELFYKASSWPDAEPSDHQRRRIQRARQALERTFEMERLLAPRFAEAGISFARTVAADPERVISLTTAVEGVPMGKPRAHAFTRPGRERYGGWLETTGRAIRLVEDCTHELVGASEDGSVEGLRLDEEDEAAKRRWRVSKARSLPESLRRALPGAWDGLLARALSAPDRLVFAHGDLSSSNILVSDRLGVIDFVWVPRLRGFDLANLAYRVEFDDPVPARVASSWTESLLAGYGEEALAQSPAWLYHRVGALLKVLDERRSRRPRGLQRKRAISELEEIVSLSTR